MNELLHIRREFPDSSIQDLEESLAGELRGCGLTFGNGARVAVAVGSRGIARLPTIVRTVIDWLKDQGAEPFIVPAMGSHGGATAAGQLEVLSGYGIREREMAAPIRASMEVVELPHGDLPVPVYFDRLAAEANHTVIINRVKPHTSFRAEHESGLIKMVAIGLGKEAGARSIHHRGIEGLVQLLPRVARQSLTHNNVALGIAVVENEYDQPAIVRAVPRQRFFEEDKELLELARQLTPRLPVSELDVLIVDEIGKNISGLGMDTNVIGRLKIAGYPEPTEPRIKMIVVLDLEAKSQGNACGIGLADITTRRLFEKTDLAATYANVLTTGFLERGKIPIVAESDQEALRYALQAARVSDPGVARIIRIRNTLRLEQILVSRAVYDEIRGDSGAELVGSVSPLFDLSGRLVQFPG